MRLSKESDPVRELCGISFVALLHVAVILMLLRDHITLPLSNIGQSVVVQLLKEENHPPTNVVLPALNLRVPLVTIEPPQIELPFGKQAPPQPMVVIEAKFSPEEALSLSATEYPTNLGRFADTYHADVSVQIFEDGNIGDVHIEGSDGNQTFDNFIVAYAAAHWHFIPSMSDGVPVLSWKIIHVILTSEGVQAHT